RLISLSDGEVSFGDQLVANRQVPFGESGEWPRQPLRARAHVLRAGHRGDDPAAAVDEVLRLRDSSAHVVSVDVVQVLRLAQRAPTKDSRDAVLLEALRQLVLAVQGDQQDAVDVP